MNISKGFLYSSLASLAWAVSIVLLRILLQNGEDVYNVVFWSSFIALPYWIYQFSKSRDELRRIQKRDVYIILGMGIISTVFISVTESLALKYSPAINYSFLIRTVIVFTFVFAYLFLGEKISKKKIILGTIMLTGAYILSTNGKAISFSVGDGFTILEAALIAFGNNVLGKMSTNRMSVNFSSSSMQLVGFIPILLITVMYSRITIPVSITWIVILTILYIVITRLRFTAYKHASASYITMIFSFTPVFVSFMAIPLLREYMTPIQIIGGLLIILSGILVEKLHI